MNWIVNLSPELIEQVNQFALDRNRLKRRADVRDQKIGPQDTEAMDFWGIRAEAAYSVKFELPMHQLAKSILSGDGGCYDFETIDYLVEVKTRFPDPNNRYFFFKQAAVNRWFHYKDGDPLEKRPPHIIVCAHPVSETSILLMGWCWQLEFRRKCEYHDQYEPSLKIHQRYLHPMDALIDVFATRLNELERSELEIS